jgi:hypothetical protein
MVQFAARVGLAGAAFFLLAIWERSRGKRSFEKFFAERDDATPARLSLQDVRRRRGRRGLGARIHGMGGRKKRACTVFLRSAMAENAWAYAGDRVRQRAGPAAGSVWTGARAAEARPRGTLAFLRAILQW